MKIGLLGTAGARDAAVPGELLPLVSKGTQLRVYPTKVPIFAYTPVEFAVQQLSYLEAGLRAAEDGCDAIIYNSFADYGIAALKAAVAIPVVGAGEATLALAAGFGGRFSIVTVWPRSTNYILLGLIREYGLERQLAGIRNVSAEDIIGGGGRPDVFIANMQSGRDGTLDRIVAACRAAAQDGVRSIVLGCTCMSPIASQIAEHCDVPTLNPLAVAATTAEMRVKLGLGNPDAATTAPRLASLEVVRRMIASTASAEIEAECPVCVA